MKCQYRVGGRYTAQTLLCAVLELFNIFIIFCKTAFLDPDAMFYLFCTPGAWKTFALGAQLRRPVRGFLLAPLGAVRLLGAARPLPFCCPPWCRALPGSESDSATCSESGRQGERRVRRAARVAGATSSESGGHDIQQERWARCAVGVVGTTVARVAGMTCSEWRARRAAPCRHCRCRERNAPSLTVPTLAAWHKRK